MLPFAFFSYSGMGQLKSGEIITDFPQDNQPRPVTEHISREIESLFIECIHTPTHALRGRADKADAKRPGVLKAKVAAAIEPRLPELYAIAESARVFALSNSRRTDELHPLRLALRASLLCISDCERYLDSFGRARAAAELVLCLYPGDAAAHGKLGVLAWKRTDSLSANNLLAMHHFCFELANNPPAILDGKLVVSRFVEHVRNEWFLARPGSSRRKSPKFDFTSSFISAAWSIVVDDDLQPVAANVASTSSMWSKLEDCLEEHAEASDRIDENDLKHIVGIAIFVRYRVSPSGNGTLRLEVLRADLADVFIARLFIVFGKRIHADMLALGKAMRARRKNRVRHMQRKRKTSSTLGSAAILTVPALTARDSQPAAAGLDRFASARERVGEGKMLSIGSFLAHFWSKSVVISQKSSLALYKEVLDVVDGIFHVIEQFDESAAFTSLFAQVTSTVMGASTKSSESPCVTLPALDEDVAFSTFGPCLAGGMFRRVNLTRAHDERILFGSDANSVAGTISKMENAGDAFILRPVCGNHSEAFARRIFTSAFPNDTETRKDHATDLRALVELGLRKQRLDRIRRRITSYGGGRVARYQPRSEETEKEDLCRTLSSPHDPAQRDDDVSKPANADALTAGAPARQPPHKRRRIAAAKSQAPAYSGLCDAEEVFFTPGKPSMPRLATPRTAQANASNRKDTTGLAMPAVSTPLQSVALETPRVLGQPVPNATPPADTGIPVANIDELGLRSYPVSTCEAIDVVLYKHSKERDMRCRWRRKAIDIDAAQGNPFLEHRLDHRRVAVSPSQRHLTLAFN